MRTRLAKRLLGDDRGTTTVEFALIFPFMVAVLFGIIDIGRFIGARVTLAQAAMVGARTACLNSTNSQSALDSAVAGATPMLSGVSVQEIDCLGTPCGTWPKATGDRVVVRTRYNFQAIFYKTLTKTMDQTSRMVCE